MGADGVGVDTTSAEQAGGEVASLAERYAGISTSFQTEMSRLSDASCNEMPVANGALDYCADVVGQLTSLQAHTNTLGTSAVSGAAAARRADDDIGSGLGSIYAA
ncbi:MAG: hypothetical protein ACR2JG_04235 [Geodermatophilaceae bacterium]